MNYQTCPVYDCCGGTIIRDNGMRARCRTCDGRGVVEAPRVPPVTSTCEPMVVTVARGTDVHDYAPAKGSAMPDYERGIREGERRMLRVVFIGAACACVLYWQLGEKYDRKPHYDRELRDMYDFAAHAASETSIAALHALRDLGDEDAPRALGERGR